MAAITRSHGISLCTSYLCLSLCGVLRYGWHMLASSQTKLTFPRTWTSCPLVWLGELLCTTLDILCEICRAYLGAHLRYGVEVENCRPCCRAALLNYAAVMMLAYALYYMTLEPFAGLTWALVLGAPMWVSATYFFQHVSRAWAWALGAHLLGWFMQVTCCTHIGHKLYDGAGTFRLTVIVTAD